MIFPQNSANLLQMFVDQGFSLSEEWVCSKVVECWVSHFSLSSTEFVPKRSWSLSERPFQDALLMFRTKERKKPKPDFYCHIHQHANWCRFLNLPPATFLSLVPTTLLRLKLHHSRGIAPKTPVCSWWSILISESHPWKSFDTVIHSQSWSYYVKLLRWFFASNLEI